MKNAEQLVQNNIKNTDDSHKKKILLLCDDIRFMSGISTMAREFVIGLSHKYNFSNIGGSVTHPEKGKVIDISESIRNDFNIPNANVKIFPTDGYGTPDMVRQLIQTENPDAILHFTDPRFWGWLYSIEREIRQKIPLLYYTIWDDLPLPIWNKPFYESCDGLFAISKQTKNICEQVLGDDNWCSLETIKESKCKRLVTYVPHGINESVFKPVDESELIGMRKELFGDKEYKFVLFYNNRNIRRKKTSDCILAYKWFCDQLPKEESLKCVFLMHTQIRDENGTDLKAVKDALCPDYDVIWTDNIKYAPDKLNLIYNIADVTINLSDNEGWGLATTESIMSGTPIIATVTGGLQDQMGFVDDEGKEYFFDKDFSTNHLGKYKTHGEWVKPLFPACRSLQGSIPTPYIFADHVKIEDATDAIKYWYDMGREKRKACGLKGREWGINGHVSAKNMCKKMIESIETVLENWVPRKKYELYNSNDLRVKYPSGMGVLV